MALADLFAVPAQQHVADRPQRVHDAGHVGRVQLVFDKLRDRLSRPHAVLEPHVIVVQENRIQPRVVSCGFHLLFDDVTHFARRIAADAAVVGDVDQLEGLNGLGLPVFGDLEVFLREIVNGIALPVVDDDVDANEVDVGAENRAVPVARGAAPEAAAQARSVPAAREPSGRPQQPPA